MSQPKATDLELAFRSGPDAPTSLDWERMHPNDAALVEGVRLGVPEAGAQLHAAVAPTIVNAVRRVLKNSSGEFEDLVQDTFERVLRGIMNGQFRGRSRLTTWAHSIARHVALDWLKQRTTEQTYLESFAEGVASPETFQAAFERRLEARSEMRRIQRILARMKEKSVRAFVLQGVYEYTVGETARILGIGVTAAQARLCRARDELARRSAGRLDARGRHVAGKRYAAGKTVEQEGARRQAC